MRKSHSRRGSANGSKRGVPDKQVHRTEVRYSKGRVRDAMEEAREEQRRLEERLAREAEQPAVGATAGAAYVAAEKAARERERELAARRAQEREESIRSGHRFEPWEGDGKPGWTIGQARKMLRDGYAVKHVMRMTGVGYRWLSDIPLDDDLRGMAE